MVIIRSKGTFSTSISVSAVSMWPLYISVFPDLTDRSVPLGLRWVTLQLLYNIYNIMPVITNKLQYHSSSSTQPRSQPVAFGALACPDRPQACPEILSPNFIFIISVIISPGYSLIRARRLSLVHREKELDESADWV